MIRAFLLNPGFSVASRHRLVFRLRQRGGPLARAIARLVWLSNVRAYGCYISSTARIGPGLLLPHPVGIVIGDDVEIGDNATIYQHVTLGRRDSRDQSYPVIGNDVVIYAGAVVIGGITVGDGAVIAANAVVINDVPAGKMAVGIPARITTDTNETATGDRP
jgi:serine O-acetyltransferase